MKRRLFLFTGFSLVATATTACSPSSPELSSEIAPNIDFTHLLSPANDVIFRFIAIGDVGTGKTGQYQVAQAMTAYWQAISYPLVLMLGDNIYDNGEIEKISQTFEQPYKPLLDNNVTFRAVLGNHDVRTNNGDSQVVYPGYTMPDRYYTFTQGPVQFFALDTTQSYLSNNNREQIWGNQLNWLATELRQSTATWKIVFGHHPLYSSGSHGSNPELAKDLQPLFSKYGVQLYLNGHDHNYERTIPLTGTTYITSGNGAKLRNVGQSEWTAYASSQLGFTAFDVCADRIDIRAIGPDGNVFDEARLVDSSINQSVMGDQINPRSL